MCRSRARLRFHELYEVPKPHFVGYLPKRTGDADKTLAPFGVIDVASVSNCISSAPDDWVEHWKHNNEGFHDTEELAMSILPSSDVARYDLYAYPIVPDPICRGC